MVKQLNGTRKWYQNNLYHRADGPAFEYLDGGYEWYCNGQLHRTDGPAVEHANGHREWYQNGQLHRDDGPAVEYRNGIKTDEWFLDDIKYSFKDWLRQNTELDSRTRMLYVLRYSGEVA